LHEQLGATPGGQRDRDERIGIGEGVLVGSVRTQLVEPAAVLRLLVEDRPQHRLEPLLERAFQPLQPLAQRVDTAEHSTKAPVERASECPADHGSYGRAGTPWTRAPGATSRSTTAPAATVAPAPTRV